MVEALAAERAGTGLARWNAHFAALLAEAYGRTGQTAEGLRVVNEELARYARNGMLLSTKRSCIESKENYC